MTGYTSSTGFPGTATSPVQSAYAGAEDGFVTEVAAGGTGIVYSTYLGGTGTDEGESVAVDAAGRAYVSGTTTSAAFPGTSTSLVQSTPGGDFDGFVTELAAGGTAILSSTYLGGTGFDAAGSIALDATGNVYLAGATASTDFPGVSAHSAQSTNGGVADGFVAEIAAGWTGLVYATYLGGGAEDHTVGLAVDAAGRAVVAGTTRSTDFPVTPNAIQTSHAGGDTDVFVSWIQPGGAFLATSSYLGGAGNDVGQGLALDRTGNVYVTGVTTSPAFPGTASSTIQPQYLIADAFAVKIGEPSVLAVPALSSPLLVLLALALAGSGLWWLRR